MRPCAKRARRKSRRRGWIQRSPSRNASGNSLKPESLEENLYEVPSDSLVVVGAAGSSAVRDLLFGSTLELIQKTLPNPLVVVGSEARVF